MSDVKWIKLATDFFSDQKIEMIEGEYPEEIDQLLIIWIKLMVQAGKDNNGGIFALDNGKPYSIKNFASLFHRPVELVEKALSIFMEYGMIEKDDDTYYLPKWERYQSQDAYERKKERDRAYQQKRRDAKKEVEKSKEVEPHTKDVKKKEELKEDNTELNETTKGVIEYLNQKTGSKFKASSANTKTLVHARMEDGYNLEDFRIVIDNKADDWLGDSHWEKFLRPQTLFGTKFESYLNEKHTKRAVNNCIAPGTETDLDAIF